MTIIEAGYTIEEIKAAFDEVIRSSKHTNKDEETEN